MAGFSLDDFDIVKASTLKTPRDFLIYGPPGKGKTVLAASIVKVPGFERTLILDTEGGAVSVGNWHPEADVLPVPTAQAFTRAFEGLIQGKLVERTSGLPYQAVVIDTFDKAQQRQIEVFDRSPEAVTNGKKNERYKWGAIKTWTAKVSDAAHQSDILFLYVVHSDDYTNEDTGVSINTVMLQGSARSDFPSVPDAVGYFDAISIKEGDKKIMHRAIDFRLADKKITKQRFDQRLDGQILDPTMTKIFDKINGEN